MILPDLPRDKMTWDRYKAFHWAISQYGGVEGTTYYTNNMFVVFDTGEVIAPLRDPGPDHRGHYSALNLDVVMVGESACPSFTTEDGTRVPKAWLTQNGAYKLIVDRDTKRAIALGFPTVDAVPHRFTTTQQDRGTRHATIGAYFPGPGCHGVGQPIKLHRPASVLSAESREAAQDLFNTARMRLQLGGFTPKRQKYLTHPIDPARLARLNGLEDLTDGDYESIYHFDHMGKAVLTVPYLLADI